MDDLEYVMNLRAAFKQHGDVTRFDGYDTERTMQAAPEVWKAWNRYNAARVKLFIALREAETMHTEEDDDE